MKTNDTIIIGSLVLVLLFMVFFADSVITGIILLPFANLQINGLVYIDCDGTNQDFCYNADTTDGGEILNCLHGGACPVGVSYEDDIAEELINADGTVDVGGLLVTDSDSDTTTVTTIDTMIDSTTRDRDGDGIFDAFDECVLEPETVNGFHDDDGCPESIHGDNVLVTDLPEVSIADVILNPPEIVSSIYTNANSESPVNLNTSVDYAIFVYVIVIIAIVIIIAILVKRII